jgi:hypothetical protein
MDAAANYIQMQKLLADKMKDQKLDPRQFYQKSVPFRYWLNEVNGISFDKIGTRIQKKLFRLFVKNWNGGKLSDDVYAISNPESSTSYKSSDIVGLCDFQL